MALSASQFPDPSQQDNHDPHNYLANPHFPKGEGGQGKLLTEQQYPRGYGPQRSARIEASLPKIVTPRLTADKWAKETTWGVPVDLTSKQARRETRERAVDAIKRSTIPAEHLATLRGSIKIDPASSSTHYRYTDQNIVIGGGHGWIPNGVSRAADVGLPHSLAHELGHHVAHTRLGAAYSTYKTDPKMGFQSKGPGVAEAHADAYAAQHLPRGDTSTQGYTSQSLASLSGRLGQSPTANINRYLETSEKLGYDPGEKFGEMDRRNFEMNRREERRNSSDYAHQFELPLT